MPLPLSLRALVRTTASIARVPDRALIAATGSQATEFLHGILSTSVPNSPRPFFGAFLHAQGRVLYDVLVYSTTDDKGQRAYLIEHDARSSDAPPLLDVLKRHVLRSKVRLRDASEQYDIWAAWGSDGHAEQSVRQWSWARSGVVEPVWEAGTAPWGTRELGLHDRRAPGFGSRILTPVGKQPVQASDHDLLPSSAYTLHRVLNGVPEGIIDMPPLQALPMESNLDLMGGVDFRKGCYVGQELTVRTYHTGLLRKRIVPVALHRPDSAEKALSTDETAALPAEVDFKPVSATPIKTRSRGSGKLLTRLEGVGLALLRLDHVDASIDGQMRLQNEDGTVQAVPWKPEWWPEPPAPEVDDVTAESD